MCRHSSLWTNRTDLLQFGAASHWLLHGGLERILRVQGSESTAQNKELNARLQGILDDRREIEEGEEDRDSTVSRRKQGTPRSTKTPLTLTSYEQQIASEIVHPSEIPVSFADIGGLDDIISDLQESVIYPLTLPHLYSQSSPLLSAPSGVLLYGPPGCGKTMLAKALAHESNACFINLHISTLTEKWYGDSNKLVSAVFSLARKLAPSIVFIDEIDAVLGSRRTGEHEASGMIKAEMMTHIDGLTSANKGTRDPQRILVLGATNRMQDIDEAILRRMPKRFAVSLPDTDQRRRIFKLILRDTKIDKSPDENGNKRHFDLEYLVKISDGMSGSDIKEACREAAMVGMREFIQSRRVSGQPIKAARPSDMRGLRTEDFFKRPVSSSTKKMMDEVDDGFETDEESDGYEDAPSSARKPTSSRAT